MLDDLWKSQPIEYLIRSTSLYVVFLDHAWDLDWETADEWKGPNDPDQHYDIVAKASSLEANSGKGLSQEEKVYARRLIGQGLALSFEHAYQAAKDALANAESYITSERLEASKRREDAIRNQVKIRDDWRWYYRLWTTLHYLIGITALFASTLVAAKPDWIGQFASMLAWLVAFLTALLTFLTPDKRAKQYIEAWTLLSSEIDRYNSDESRTLNDVLKAYHQGDAIVRETRGGQQYQSI